MADSSQIRRYYAESGQQSTLDQLDRSGGWAAVEADYNRRMAGGGQPSGQIQTAQSPVDIAQQMYQLANQFRQPAIQTLQGQQPGITSAYQGLSTAAAGQKPNIEQRYKDTLAEITQTTRGAAATEFTRRGIPLSSGLVEQTVGSRLAPQIAGAATQRDVNLQGIDQLLAQIGMGQQGAQTGLAQAIAAIQSASSGEAISSAQNIYGQQQTAAQNAIANKLAQQTLDLQKQQTAYDIGKPYYAPTTGGGLDSVTQSLLSSLFGGGATTPTTGNAPTYSPSGGAGSYSSDKKWYFTGSNWVPVVA